MSTVTVNPTLPFAGPHASHDVVRDALAGQSPASIQIDTADHVKHGPSDETWVVLRVEGEHLYPGGWPPTRAALRDCTLVKKASAEKRLQLLREIAAGGTTHVEWARATLGVDSSQKGSTE